MILLGKIKITFNLDPTHSVRNKILYTIYMYIDVEMFISEIFKRTGYRSNPLKFWIHLTVLFYFLSEQYTWNLQCLRPDRRICTTYRKMKC